ncbi:dienelactone hydrolase [Kribbella pratensis]|uniref:Dienelactone hydrolase n=1 Tax=Kribbella pratensis TaxID=2512112 RepID=A0ABY2FIH0_9ACTN|nr:alpha/beta hydrolase [Kribbella pratensis]TDW92898.1 dienelactone hydrolase [Kribbella pratensis]
MKVEQVVVDARGVQLPGELAVPSPATGLVIFAHGSDSSRHSPRNKYVAQVLDRAGLGTLLFDLLSPDEARDRRNVFDIPLLAERLTAAHGWARRRPGLGDLPVGYFGASTGGAAAVWSAGGGSRDGVGDGVGDSATGRASDVRAVVSRGGRVDLAGPQLADVTAPTLLVVGELDADVLRLNRESQQRLRCVNRLEIVAGATHLFTEPGTLERVAELARDWFRAHL